MNHIGMNTLSLEREGDIATLFLDRPEKRNAMNRAMFEELGTAAESICVDDLIKVVVVTGRGSSFCSGLDLGALDEFKDYDANSFRAMVRKMQRNFRSFELIEKPVIAMVNGPALGAGTEIALACDIILASMDAVFGLLEVTLGLVTDLGATQRLPRYIGIHRAKELIMTGKRISAAEAHDIGMINAVFPPEELKDQTMEMARQLADLPGTAVGLCKIALDRSAGISVESGLEYEAQSQSICFSEILKKMQGETG